LGYKSFPGTIATYQIKNRVSWFFWLFWLRNMKTGARALIGNKKAVPEKQARLVK
jgi:hypothetical protein